MLDLDVFTRRVKPQIPRKKLLLAIRSLLKFHVLQFDDACFRQMEGGAMENLFI